MRERDYVLVNWPLHSLLQDPIDEAPPRPLQYPFYIALPLGLTMPHFLLYRLAGLHVESLSNDNQFSTLDSPRRVDQCEREGVTG